jgi:hypothetical protein
VGQSLVDHALHFLNGLGIQLHQDSIEYFKGIASFLEGKGFTVYAPRVSFGAGVRKRSEDLRDALNGILAGGNGKVHIIAHSMGWSQSPLRCGNPSEMMETATSTK